MPAESPVRDRLHNLADRDERDLRAFLEKRDWFESKLRYLQSLPPVSRFSEVKTESDYLHTPELPKEIQVEEWQAERDKIEHEVLAFDGGDLSRMKNKTKEATLLPLTPPSTRLVSITLDLILVVDQLLTSLRQRADHLELMLSWHRWRDQMKSAELQAHALQAELTTLVYQRVQIGNPTANTAVLPSLSEASKVHSLGKTSNLVLADLRTRHASLVTSGRKAGQELDRMVDIALTLDASAASQSAIPETLLDAQDRLDGQIEELHGKMEWIQEIVHQRECAHVYGTALAQIHQGADALMIELSEALDAPASSMTHRRLQAIVDSFRLPTEDVPRPRHADFPDHDRDLVAELEQTRREALNRLSDCQAAVDWYEDLVTKYEAIANRQLKVEQACAEIQAGLGDLSQLGPDFDDPTMLRQDFSAWIMAASQHERWRRLVGEARTHARRAQLEVILCRQALQAGPAELASCCLVNANHLEVPFDRAYELAMTLAEKSDIAEVDLAILRVTQPVLHWITHLNDELASLTARVDLTVGNIPGSEVGSLERLLSCVRNVDSCCTDNLLGEIVRLYSELEARKRSLPALKSYIDSSLARIRSDISRTSVLAHGLNLQLRLLNDMRSEATAWSKRLAEHHPVDCNGAAVGDLDRQVQANDMMREVTSWEVSVSDRMSFIGDLHPNAAKADDYIRRETNSIILQVRASLATVCNHVDMISTTLADGPAKSERSEARGVSSAPTVLEADHQNWGLIVSRELVELEPQLDLASRQSDESSVVERLPCPPEVELPHQTIDLIVEESAGILPHFLHRTETDQLKNALVRLHNAVCSLTQPVNLAPLLSDVDKHFTSLVDASDVEAARHVALALRADLIRLQTEAQSLRDSWVTVELERVLAVWQEIEGLLQAFVAGDSEVASDSVGQNALGHVASSRSRALSDISRRGTRRALTPRASLPVQQLSSRVQAFDSTSLGHPSTPAAKPVSLAEATKLDFAVGRVVRGLNIDLPIVPATSQGSKDWEDETGRYWIGAEGHAKLCYCRILRSRMVMVRVGGGWMELSKFILDHFREAFHPRPLHLSNANSSWLSSDVSLGSMSPLRVVPMVQQTPASSRDAAAPNESQSRSLLPVQFIRRASESPPIRDKEKARMTRGLRNSSLGGREA